MTAFRHRLSRFGRGVFALNPFLDPKRLLGAAPFDRVLAQECLLVRRKGEQLLAALLQLVQEHAQFLDSGTRRFRGFDAASGCQGDGALFFEQTKGSTEIRGRERVQALQILHGEGPSLLGPLFARPDDPLGRRPVGQVPVPDFRQPHPGRGDFGMDPDQFFGLKPPQGHADLRRL